ncbi:hypothetical protein C8R44DRAFT_889991 [Mycena epipterygia]|nr:hypothetical protein C8R44DRAFT_889991 [Mycena epipterygia]
MCFALLERMFADQCARHWLLSALENGLLRAIVSALAVHLGPPIGRQVDFMLKIVAASSVYYPILGTIGAALCALDAPTSTVPLHPARMHAKWQKFEELIRGHLAVLEMFNSEYVARKACDNSQCSKIADKAGFQRCSGCLSFYYCSQECPIVDWGLGGHRLACAAYGTLRLNDRQRLRVREREFLRALVHHDYRYVKPSIDAQQDVLLRKLAGRGLVTTFDYTDGPVRIAMSADDGKGMEVHGEQWLDSVARAAISGGRLALHVVQISEDPVKHFFLVPLRKGHSGLGMGDPLVL